MRVFRISRTLTLFLASFLALGAVVSCFAGVLGDSWSYVSFFFLTGLAVVLAKVPPSVSMVLAAATWLGVAVCEPPVALLLWASLPVLVSLATVVASAASNSAPAVVPGAFSRDELVQWSRQLPAGRRSVAVLVAPRAELSDWHLLQLVDRVADDAAVGRWDVRSVAVVALFARDAAPVAVARQQVIACTEGTRGGESWWSSESSVDEHVESLLKRLEDPAFAHVSWIAAA